MGAIDSPQIHLQGGLPHCSVLVCEQHHQQIHAYCNVGLLCEPIGNEGRVLIKAMMGGDRSTYGVT